MIRRQQPVEIDGAPLQLRAIRTLDAGPSTVALTRRRARVGHGKERVVHARSVARRLLRSERFLHNLGAVALLEFAARARGLDGPPKPPGRRKIAAAMPPTPEGLHARSEQPTSQP